MSRYTRKVPPRVRRLIKRHRLGRPNWYIGSAEGGWGADIEDTPISPAMRAEIDRVKASMRSAFDG